MFLKYKPRLDSIVALIFKIKETFVWRNVLAFEFSAGYFIVRELDMGPVVVEMRRESHIWVCVLRDWASDVWGRIFVVVV